MELLPVEIIDMILNKLDDENSIIYSFVCILWKKLLIKKPVINGAKLMTYNAFKGNFDLIMWLTNNGCKWDENACASAAYNGHLEILKWFIKNGYILTERICERAASGNQIEIIKWTYENGCEFHYNTIERTIIKNNLELFKFLFINYCKKNEYIEYCLSFAKRLYRDEMIEFINGYKN